MQHDPVEVSSHAGVELVPVDVNRMACYFAGEPQVAPCSNCFIPRTRTAEDRLDLRHRQSLQWVRSVRKNLERKCFMRCPEGAGADLDPQRLVSKAPFEAVDLYESLF